MVPIWLLACGSGTGKIELPAETESTDNEATQSEDDTTIPETEPSADTTTEDTSVSEPEDAPEPSSDSEDTADPPEERISCSVGTQFVSPQDFEFYIVGAATNVAVQLDELGDYAGYSIRWEDIDENTVATTTADSQGQAVYSGSDYTQQKGVGLVFARLITPDGICATRIEKPLSVCADYLLDGFTTEPTNWVMHGDAYWDSGGWVEMTGNGQGMKGAVYNNQDVISQGAASIRFTLQTGNGMNTGADGFAFTIINISNSNDLADWLTQASSGSGLAYGIGGAYGNWTGDAVTVEIDTWHNVYNGTNELHTDPTNVSHIAVTKNADPGDHLVWFEVPTVEDFQPHTIRVDTFGGILRVSYDGTEVINQQVPLNFKGGQMFFSGSTGWATNYHIFDDLEILHDCQ